MLSEHEMISVIIFLFTMFVQSSRAKQFGWIFRSSKIQDDILDFK